MKRIEPAPEGLYVALAEVGISIRSVDHDHAAGLYDLVLRRGEYLMLQQWNEWPIAEHHWDFVVQRAVAGFGDKALLAVVDGRAAVRLIGARVPLIWARVRQLEETWEIAE